MEIFVHQNGQQTGPFDEATVRARLNAGELTPSDQVWHEGLSASIPITQFIEPTTVVQPSPVSPVEQTNGDAQRPPPTQSAAEADRQFCASCGKENRQSSNFCTSCGHRLVDGVRLSTPSQANVVNTEPAPDQFVKPKKLPVSPNLCWLNLIFPGLAELIFGQVGKGVVIFIGTYIISRSIAAAIGGDDYETVNGVYCGLAILARLVFLVDAFAVAAALNDGRSVQKWQFFP